MKRQCELVEQDWDGMIPALIEKKFDAIIASMSITPERKERVDFTKKYYHTPAMFFGPAGAGLTDDAAALKGKRIGVQRGTIHQQFMEAKYPDVELVLYGTQDEVYLDLVNGRLDAGMADSIAVDDGFLKTDQGKGFAFFGSPHSDPAIHGEGAGIAIRKGEAELREAFNTAIQALRANGKYDEIQKKYFAFDVYGS
jgi:ABC-type amino acid transport substrate-binding protein